MGAWGQLKKMCCRIMVAGKVDNLYRYFNRQKLVVVMYHGVTTRNYDPLIWTRLPVDLFRNQLQFLKKNYHPVSLSQVVDAISNRIKLPDNAVLITFDDGLKNNYSNAFPLLCEYSIPATMFLTSDYVDTEKNLWFDELYLLLLAAFEQGCNLDILQQMGVGPGQDKKNLDFVYQTIVEKLKRKSMVQRLAFLADLKSDLTINLADYHEDFGFMSWQNVREMADSGLVEFGGHTANHRILSNLADDDLSSEIQKAKETLEKNLGKEIAAFAYPNGIPEIDFNNHHEEYLKKIGFLCAFSTKGDLHHISTGNAFSIGRISVGSDMTSDPDHFSLSTAGALVAFQRMKFIVNSAKGFL